MHVGFYYSHGRGNVIHFLGEMAYIIATRYCICLLCTVVYHCAGSYSHLNSQASLKTWGMFGEFSSPARFSTLAICGFSDHERFFAPS